MEKITRGKHNSEELAYTAGFIDGEGSIFIARVLWKSGNILHILHVSTSNTNKETIEWFHQKYNDDRTKVTYRHRNPKHRTSYQWLVTGTSAQRFLELILPYLKQKKRQAELAIEFQKRKTGEGRTGKKLTKEAFAWREKYCIAIRKLNLGKLYKLKTRIIRSRREQAK